jgi:hypothetical protein
MCLHPGWWWAIYATITCGNSFPSPMSSEGPRRGRESHARGWDAETGAGGTSLLDRDPRLMAGPGPRRELVQRRLDALTSDFGHYVYAYDDRVAFTSQQLRLHRQTIALRRQANGVGEAIDSDDFLASLRSTLKTEFRMSFRTRIGQSSRRFSGACRHKPVAARSNGPGLRGPGGGPWPHGSRSRTTSSS